MVKLEVRRLSGGSCLLPPSPSASFHLQIMAEESEELLA